MLTLASAETAETAARIPLPELLVRIEQGLEPVFEVMAPLHPPRGSMAAQSMQAIENLLKVNGIACEQGPKDVDPLTYQYDLLAFGTYFTVIPEQKSYVISVIANKGEAGYEAGVQTIRDLKNRFEEACVSATVYTSSVRQSGQFPSIQVPVTLLFNTRVPVRLKR